MLKKTVVYSPRCIIPLSPNPLEQNLCNKLRTTYLKPNSRLNLDTFDQIIVVGPTIDYIKGTDFQKTKEATRREREIFNALNEGKTVCLLFQIDLLFKRVLKRAQIRYNSWVEPQVDLKSRRPEFDLLIKNYGSTKYDWIGDFEDILCMNNEKKIVGFSKKVQNGLLIFLPCYMPIDDFWNLNVLRDFLPRLLEALEKYCQKTQKNPPDWLNSYLFPNELPLIEEINRLQREIDEKNNSLEKSFKLKEILWLRDDALVSALISFFNFIGIQTKQDEVCMEDFWITENKIDSIIVEVKGLDKNVTRRHINKLEDHREARGKADDFPALLIVNSFNSATTLNEKDVAISPNEITRAVRNNVLLIRTIDLCNAYSLILKKKLTSTKLLEVLKTKKGWLHITEAKYEILTA